MHLRVIKYYVVHTMLMEPFSSRVALTAMQGSVLLSTLVILLSKIVMQKLWDMLFGFGLLVSLDCQYFHNLAGLECLKT